MENSQLKEVSKKLLFHIYTSHTGSIIVRKKNYLQNFRVAFRRNFYGISDNFDNVLIIQEVIKLSRRLRHKADQAHKLQYMLSRKGHEGVTLAEEQRETEATPTTSSAKDSQQ